MSRLRATRSSALPTSAATGGPLEQPWDRILADMAHILFVLEEDAERALDDSAIELLRAKGHQRQRPVEGLRPEVLPGLYQPTPGTQATPAHLPVLVETRNWLKPATRVSFFLKVQ